MTTASKRIEAARRVQREARLRREDERDLWLVPREALDDLVDLALLRGAPDESELPEGSRRFAMLAAFTEMHEQLFDTPVPKPLTVTAIHAVADVVKKLAAADKVAPGSMEREITRLAKEGPPCHACGERTELRLPYFGSGTERWACVDGERCLARQSGERHR